MKNKSQEELYGDPGLALRVQEESAEQNVIGRMVFDAKEIVMGGIDLLRKHPVGSIEVGGAIAATGVALGALIVPRLRHAH
jgi:hypothetical protein